jgi:carbamate kinase
MGHEFIVSHGNGPQVGMIHLAFENGKEQGLTPLMPLPECTAMSQGYIGYHLQQAIDEQLMRKGSNKPVITMLTQVIVDENDPAFQNPTKPIGSYYDEEPIKTEAGNIIIPLREISSGLSQSRRIPQTRPHFTKP